MDEFDIPIAVIFSADMKILGSDIGGVVACERLFNQFIKYDQCLVKAFSSDSQLNECATLMANCSNVKILTFNKIDLGDWNEKGVLLIDARAWLSRRDLEFILLKINKMKNGFKFFESAKNILQNYREAIVMAIYLPPQKISTQLFVKKVLPIDQGLKSIIIFDALADMPNISGDELDGSIFSMLVTSYIDMAEIERRLYLKRAIGAMHKGVRIRDPYSVYIKGSLTCGVGVEINPNVTLEGDILLGDKVKVGSNSILRNCQIGDNTVINPFSLIEYSSVGSDSFIGPFGRIRPGCVIGNKVQIGNYVEIKNSHIGDCTRINHHTFIGDSLLADQVTIGAGTITCNHDGIGISETVIERGAYIGSGCNLVAPLNIGAGATIGAGSTITKNVPAAKLTLARSVQTTIHGWVKPKIQGVGK